MYIIQEYYCLFLVKDKELLAFHNNQMIRLLSGKTVQIPIRKGMTVRDLQKEVQKQTKAKDDAFALLINGMVMDEDQTLEFYRILCGMT